MIEIKKKIGFLGTSGYIKGSTFLETSELLNKVGANTGNLLFQYAVYHSIKEEKLIIGEDITWDVQIVQEQCRLLVIPSANFIRENFDISGFVDFLDKTGLPLLFLGLGAQANDYSKEKFDLHPSILKLIKLLKERSIYVGVRGDFTKKVLESFSVDNCKIIGCPTNFINHKDDFIQNLEEKWCKKDIFSFIATGDEPWPKDNLKKEAERLMIKWVAEGNALYNQQSVEPFIRYARQNNVSQSKGSVPEHHEKSLRDSLAPQMSLEEFRAFISTKLRLYYSADQWMEDNARFDFSLGLRLHGNMAAWQAGTPAIWVHHDARTQELVETMSLPNIGFRDFIKFNSIEELKASIDFDFKKYKNTRHILFSRYKEILHAEGISLNYEI